MLESEGGRDRGHHVVVHLGEEAEEHSKHMAASGHLDVADADAAPTYYDTLAKTAAVARPPYPESTELGRVLQEMTTLMQMHHEDLFQRLDSRLQGMQEKRDVSKSSLLTLPKIPPRHKHPPRGSPTLKPTLTLDLDSSGKDEPAADLVPEEGIRAKGGLAQDVSEDARSSKAAPERKDQVAPQHEHLVRKEGSDFPSSDDSGPPAPGMISKASMSSADRMDFRRSRSLAAVMGGNQSAGRIPAWRKKIIFMMKHPALEVALGLAIFSNAVFIGFETDVAAHHLTSAYPGSQAFRAISLLYTAVFLLELLLRILGEGKRFFTRCEGWNYLDFVIVSASIIDVIADAVISDPLSGGSAVSSTSQFRVLRILRVMRLVRLIRITRVIRFIRALRTLVHQIVHTAKSLVWALLLLSIVVFLFGTIFTQAATNHQTMKMMPGVSQLDSLSEWNATDSLEVSEALVTYWGSVPRSMFTLFKAMAGGISWEEVVLPLSDIGSWCVALFIGYICFVQFCVLNVITGVFCQNAIDSAQHDHDLVTQAVLQQKSSYVRRLRYLFQQIDEDGSGCISIEEFKENLESESVRAYFEALELDTSDVRTLFKLIDRDEGDTIELEEFIESCMRLKGHARGVDMAKLIYEQSRATKKQEQFMGLIIAELGGLKRKLPGGNQDPYIRQKTAPDGGMLKRAFSP